MTKVIDLYLDLPPVEEHLINSLSMYILGEGSRGYQGYKYTFGEKMANKIGLTIKKLETIVAEQGEKSFIETIKEASKKVIMPLDNFVKYLDDIEVEWGITSTFDHNSEKTSEIVERYPNKFMGFAYVDPRKGMDAVRQLEYDVKELKLSAAYITSFRNGVPANDRRCYPIYAKAVELGIPVFIYCSMNLAGSIAMDIGHPRYVDDVARDFPELKIMAAVGGWPWVMEMIGLALRHPNVYISTEIHAPADFTIPHKGFEPLLQWGNTKIQDKVCFASNWELQGIPLKTLVNQVLELPLDDSVKEKWLYKNASRFFDRD